MSTKFFIVHLYDVLMLQPGWDMYYLLIHWFRYTVDKSARIVNFFVLNYLFSKYSFKAIFKIISMFIKMYLLWLLVSYLLQFENSPLSNHWRELIVWKQMVVNYRELSLIEFRFFDIGSVIISNEYFRIGSYDKYSESFTAVILFCLWHTIIDISYRVETVDFFCYRFTQDSPSPGEHLRRSADPVSFL